MFDKALRGILRPLVRAMIAKGVTAPALYRIVKQTYVDVAIDTLGEGATDSRVSVLTGVHRRDVKDMRGLRDAGAEDARRKVSILSTVVGRWLGGDETTDAAGSPITLERSRGQGVTFEGLVQSISRDIRPRTVLEELLRQNIVTVDAQDRVTLSLDALVGPKDFDQRVHFFAHNVGDHMNAAVENLLDDDPQHLEQAVFYTHLSEASVAQIEAEARSLSREALLSVNKLARSLQDADIKAADDAHRFRYGVFFFQEDEGTTPNGETSNDT
jgi:hypothetical protein